MNQSLETILDEAIVRLHQQESIQSIIQDYPDYQDELAGLLSVVETGMSLPKKSIPAPYKQFKFLESPALQANTKAQSTSNPAKVFSFWKWAIIPLGISLIIGGDFVVKATENSLPGDALYTVKRATEQARLSLTSDQDKVATIHIELLQKRLDEVKRVADTGDTTSETVAISELQSQTAKTFSAVTPVATDNALSKSDTTLLNSLVAVNKEQQSVLKTLSETAETETAKLAVNSAIENTEKNSQALAQIVTKVDEQTAPNSEKVQITDTIYKISKDTLLVGKDIIQVNSETLVTDKNLPSSFSKLNLQNKVTVTGLKNSDGTITALEINVLSTGVVKGQSTTNNPETSNTNGQAPADTQSEPNSNPTNTPSQAIGGFITEPSTPQYQP